MARSANTWCAAWGLALVLSVPCCAQERPECLPCHGMRDFYIQTADGRMVNLYVNPRRYERSVHGNLLCYQCHVNMAIQPHAVVPVGVPQAAQPYVSKWRPALRPAAASCIACHRRIFQEYRKSIHAAALRRGARDAPFCSDCHGSHYMLGTEDLESQANPRNVPATCASCHSVALLMSRYDVARGTYETFQQSVHGRKLALGERDVAVCTSCHGVHDIKAPSDPESRLYPVNIVATCRECHKGASREFALSFRHVAPSPRSEPVVYWVQVAYRWAVIILVGGMAAYVLLDLYRWLLEWGRRRREART